MLTTPTFVYLWRNKCCLKCSLFPGNFDWQLGEPIKIFARLQRQITRKCRLIHNNNTNSGFMFRFLRDPVTRVKTNALSCVQNSIMSTQSGATGDKNDNRSIHSSNIEEVHNVPMQVIIRPIPPVLDELKVQSLMKTIKVISVSFYIDYSSNSSTNLAVFIYLFFHPGDCRLECRSSHRCAVD